MMLRESFETPALRSVCDLSGELSKNGYGPNVVQAALYFVQNAETFNDALNTSLEFAGNLKVGNYCNFLKW